MSTYAIGDIQGCYTELHRLLEVIQFNPKEDRLWCTGDLVNRGPHSLEVLRFIKQLGNRAIVVLGNHDLHLLAVAREHTDYIHPKDTLKPVLQASDGAELIDWLRRRPFLHHDADLGLTLIHAGLPPQWDLLQARQCACEVEEAIRGPKYYKYLANLYGDVPDKWSNDLTGWDRLRFITNCFTRLRMLEELGCQIHIANHGQEAIDMTANQHYDVVLMDLHMPVLDGYAATREIRKREQESGQPRLLIIAMTANALASDRERCLAEGMDEVLIKPVSKADLARMLREWIPS